MSRLSWKSVLVGLVAGVTLVGGLPVVAGVGDPVLQGRSNIVHQRTIIQGKSGATLRLTNTRSIGTALALNVEPGNAPLKVNSSKKVERLNADLLDGRSSGYFGTAEAEPGQTLVGGFGAAGDGTFLIHAVSFNPPLRSGIPQSRIHYLLADAGPTAECPGVFQAAAGHLCIYATWERNVAFNGIGRINNALVNSGASRYGFTILWTGTSSSANVRGNWAYTVPAENDRATETPPQSGEVTDLGVFPAP